MFPEGQPIYPRSQYGLQRFPLALVNEVLASEGQVLRATKTRSAARAIACVDAYGHEESFGLFELLRAPHHGERPDTYGNVAG